ncbi:MAG: hypothetical protein UV74_C0013G0090 [Candidatus Woesebacteria bacterium GW2011_GWB1_43_14]|uniref:Uncharacterized protein n=1 Tax=Candidatus Woesebacteria bacterium GW2011_GWB1_43_14 TaxID=1618578 RepID=A0A0G1GDL3_9BACT|nr:MAG: hypothetical protein UT21_C0004G0035 [Candidatus Woesebacteria bacterium GW2011_GWA1_39_11b]KKS77724.1 MAG: hypothetical protein UV51_C0005G0134 [Candidatus Woesebacteria bacterium GW2011_GWC1_42_9]KKS96968.1 MAG: hypothetical protein UV74_C0013G0090 [Candidatus Woesebacteria bacterium GW2011_GWB1_43_14]
MAQPKYKEYVEKMLTANTELFAAFRKIHDRYVLNPEKYQEEFNEAGREVMSVINDFEDRLCSQSERGGYGSFTTKLAEKFRAEIKKHFSEIDKVGIVVFKVPKINL